MYWPGTNIIKSKGNAFSWQGKGSQFLKELKKSSDSTQNARPNGVTQGKAFTIYSKAVPKDKT